MWAEPSRTSPQSIYHPAVPNPMRRNTQPHFVVCGDSPLAHRLADELAQVGEDVVVILPSKLRNHGPQITALPGVRVVESAQLNEEAFLTARLPRARALALVAQDDVGNIHAALRASEIKPGIRLVIRMFNTGLGNQIRPLFEDCAVLSDANMAAPWFVAAALGELTPNHIRLPGRTLCVSSRSEVPAGQVVCGIGDVDRRSGSLRLLPPGVGEPELVLAIADGARRDPLTRRRGLPRPAIVLAALRAVLNRRSALAVLSLTGLLALGTVLFAAFGGYSWGEAVYNTLLDVAGAAQPDPGLSTINKLTQVMVTLVGISAIPVITAAVVDGVVRARLSTGRVRRPLRGHIVVVGLGNVGYRVVGQLRDLGVPVVCVERNENSQGVSLARRLGATVIFGDANRDDTLRAAWVDTARALVAVTSDDVTNLQAALHARASREDVQVVLRLFDTDLAQRVERAFGIAVSRSVSYLAAPAFVAALLERQVIGTIAVGRRVLLIAEAPVAAGSRLLGRRLAELRQRHDAQVLALRAAGESTLNWAPDAEHILAPDDRVVVVASRAGLARLLARSSPAPPQDPTAVA
jgi:Trk K+ transport system NAD-binding subunit